MKKITHHSHEILQLSIKPIFKPQSFITRIRVSIFWGFGNMHGEYHVKFQTKILNFLFYSEGIIWYYSVGASWLLLECNSWIYCHLSWKIWTGISHYVEPTIYRVVAEQVSTLQTDQHRTGTDNHRYNNGQRFCVYWFIRGAKQIYILDR